MFKKDIDSEYDHGNPDGQNAGKNYLQWACNARQSPVYTVHINNSLRPAYNAERLSYIKSGS